MRSLLLQIVKIIFDRPLIRPRHFILAKSALSIRLRSGGGFFISNLALALDADAFQRDRWHLAAGCELPLHFGRFERVVQITFASVGLAAPIHIGPRDSRVVPTGGGLAVPIRAVLRPGPHTGARLAARAEFRRAFAGARR